MYFVENHSIFANISDIVDRILGEYLRRSGHNEPFFTEFCDGRTVICSGMSQWGTVALANNGMTPMQILWYYYPSDLMIDTAPVAPVTESYPGIPLSQGVQGLDLELMQESLNRIRQNYSLIPDISNPNEIYGISTDNAVTRLADLTSEGDSIIIGTIPPNAVIRLGSSGELVTQLQYMLNYIAQFYQEIPELVQDGAFGVSTQNAVTAFQNRFGLAPDGIVGPATWAQLYEVYNAVKNAVPIPPAPSPAGPVYPGTSLRLGSRGDDVALMQRYLNTLSAVFPAIPVLTADGIFGPLTETAVKAFQRQFGLVVDGIIGSATWNAIVTQYNNLQTTPPPSYITYTVQAGDTLWLLAHRLGTTVEAIKALNNLTSDVLQIGQQLRIPLGGAVPEPPPSYITHTVQAGDTLWLLAQRFGTTVEAIKALNNLTSDILQIGQQLRIPSGGTVPEPPPSYITHTVQAGDTLWLLAQRFGTTVEAIKALNNLTSDVLQIGQQLRIPSGSAPSHVVVIDAGHGGSDPGAVNGARLEKDDNLKLALAVEKRLQEQGQRVIMTRSTDVFVPLIERSEISNRNNADLFVSLHRNSNANTAANGVETFVQINSSAENITYARNVQNEIVSAGVQSNRGISQADFSVLRNTRAPSMLVELGFITNARDNELFDQNFNAYADAITRGILQSLNSQPGPPPSYFNYVVQGDDNLWSLAQRFGTTAEIIMSLNGLTSNSLSAGQILKIPNGA